MSLQWTLVAGFLYIEMAVLLLFIVPFISVRSWSKFFKSRFLQVLSKQASWYFAFVLFLLGMLLLDSIREMRKYSGKEAHEVHTHLENELQISMRLFRAQRNFYISAFSLFLSLVIKRMTTLITRQAQMEAELEASLKQAQSATAAAKAYRSSGESSENKSNEEHEVVVAKLKEKAEAAEKKVARLEKDREALKSQSQSLEKEYDRLTEEHRKLQLKLNVAGEKKDD